jgi:hypothetical protein
MFLETKTVHFVGPPIVVVAVDPQDERQWGKVV